MNTNMVKKKNYIRHHMIRMVAFFNKIEILGDKIDEKTQVDIILETLPNSFN